MTTVNVPNWAGSAETMARRVKPIIHLIAMNKAVEPSAIDDLVRPAGSSKNYSAKYITFLRLLGFEFTAQKQGRKIVSYTCIQEPANVADIRGIGAKVRKAKAPKTPKVKAAKVAKVQTPKKSAPTTKKVAAKKSVAAIKAENLAKLKSVGEKFKAKKSEIDVMPQSSFNVDGDWDSIDGLDLAKIL